VDVEAPVIFALDAEARDDLTLKNLDTLRSGLALRFGERDLTTQVNAARVEHLTTSSDQYYAESKFRLAANLGATWSLALPSITSGASASFRAGFTAEVNGRVIAPYESELLAYRDGNALSLLADDVRGRDFIVPRSLSDIESMKPGELLQLGGRGTAGLYLSANAPVWVTDSIVPGLAYRIYLNISVSVGVRTEELDLQIVRLGGDEVVIDLGTREATTDAVSVRLHDRWTVDGLIDEDALPEVPLIDLQDQIEGAIEDLLDDRLSVSARLSSTRTQHRTSLARVRFDLSHADDDSLAAGALEEAIVQASHGDFRLAQLLAELGHPGVRVDFDLSREGLSTTFYAGVDIFGMEFFSNEIESAGSTTIETPDSVRSLLFNAFSSESGIFWWRQRFSRVALAAATVDSEGTRLGANLYLQVSDDDATINRDKILDHLGGILLGLSNQDDYLALEGAAFAARAAVEAACPIPAEDFPSVTSEVIACYAAELAGPAEERRRADALTAFEAGLPELESDALALAQDAASLTYAAISAPEESPFVGPDMRVFSDVRMDDAGIGALMATEGSELRTRFEQYLSVAGVDRGSSLSFTQAERAELVMDNQNELNALSDAWNAQRARYTELLDAELPMVSGNRAGHGFVLSIARDGSTKMVPFVRARTEVMAELVDELVEIADDLSGDSVSPERVVTYGMLSALPHHRQDVRLSTDIQDFGVNEDLYTSAGYMSFAAPSRGSSVELLDGGMFDINALVR